MQLREMQSERLLRQSLSIVRAGEDPDKWVFERNRKDVLFYTGGKAEDWSPVTNIEQQQELLDTISSYSAHVTLDSVRLQSETVGITLVNPRGINRHLRGMLCVLFVVAHMENIKLKEVVKTEGDMYNILKLVL